MSMVYYHWGSLSPETAFVKALASWMGGGALGYWHHDKKREAAAGAADLVTCQWSPAPTSQGIIITGHFEGYAMKHLFFCTLRSDWWRGEHGQVRVDSNPTAIVIPLRPYIYDPFDVGTRVQRCIIFTTKATTTNEAHSYATKSGTSV